MIIDGTLQGFAIQGQRWQILSVETPERSLRSKHSDLPSSLQKFDISTQLFKEEDPEGAPVAIYHKQRRYFLVLRMSRQPYLEVKQSVMETLDSLIGTFALAYPLFRYMLNKEIVSFLLAEQKRRKKIKE